MTSTLIITQAIISDVDLCLPKPNRVVKESPRSESIGTESDSNEDIVCDETELMKSLGLPTQFTSNRAMNKRWKKSYYKTQCLKTNEDVNQLFTKFWELVGRERCVSSWVRKDNTYETIDGNEEMVTKETFESIEDLTQVWHNHCSDVYQTEYKSFLVNIDNFKNEYFDSFETILDQMMTNCVISEEHNDCNGSDSNDKSNEDNFKQTDNEVSRHPKPITSGLNSSSVGNSLLSDGSGGEEPPDERPVVIKREHESDFVDTNEDNLDLDSSLIKTQSKEVLPWSQSSNPRKKPKSKYWHQRYRLFSRFDEGIQLDTESWYSVTPERIAAHIAHRFSANHFHVIIDAFCGSGGNTIQFALISGAIRVIAIDIDPQKIDFAKHNSKIYGVDHKIDFICADYMLLAKTGALKADAVFLSPPWGGPQYLKKEKYALNMMTPNGADVFNVTNDNISTNIGILLPRNIDNEELKRLAGDGNSVELEKNLLNKKVKTVTAYFGQLITESKTLI